MTSAVDTWKGCNYHVFPTFHVPFPLSLLYTTFSNAKPAFNLSAKKDLHVWGKSRLCTNKRSQSNF